MKSITLKEVKENSCVKAYLRRADANLGELGYTEHGLRHAELVASIAGNILQRLGYAQRTQELASIAGYLHDMGNMINRHQHDAYSALLAERILADLKMPWDEIALVIGAVGNHDEEAGFPVTPVAAALIIADKADVHRSRVREKEQAKFDIHDRVNYAVCSSFVFVDKKSMTISLELSIDTKQVPVMDYFEIFLLRMNMCRRAAKVLHCNFRLFINKNRLL